jgi:NADP-dependent alcohol dehydrogenase
MKNFDFQNPTKIIFGKDTIAKLADELPKDAKIMMLYGGGSIKRNGIYEQVQAALKDHDWIEFGGIPANPEYEVLMDAISIIKKENVNYLLAVGGGSVIDGVKFISSATQYEGEEPWDILKKRVRTFEGMPFATVLTLPATGSEMNSGAVITRAETKEKLTMGGPGLFPKFSILDPQVVHSVPPRQIANGITDAFTHVLEQYMTYPAGGWLQDRFAEGIMQTLVEVAPKIMADPTDYEAASNFMWSCTMALYGIDHARTLAIITPSHYRFNFEDKKEKLAQYAERVWNVSEGSIEEKANAAIEKTEAFLHSLDIKTTLAEYTNDYEGTAEIIADRFRERKWVGLGERRKVTPEAVEEIVKMSYS